MTKKVGSDQAQSLREKLIDEVKERTGSYPPRREVHKQKQSKPKLKMKYPLIRLLVIIFIFFPFMVLSIMYYLEQKNGANIGEETIGDSVIVNFSKRTDSPDDPALETNAQEETEEKTNEETDVSSEQVDEDKPSQQENDHEEVNQQKETTQKGFGKNDVVPEEKSVKKPSEQKVITHEVQPGENLFRIAMKYYGSRDGERIIRDYNQLNGNDIYVGQLLKIPLK
ncbi:LysM domain-containing protein [Bacillus sp. FJAT-47783]|uniref:LysM peptidoglycan-binding domain-containing protein n=1 Tax=Bacillus sp. FJAT-47783 TaxID=2922712 RepID=UPI001FAC3783|nr:LysM domain-containing protein [Bacillus sp. FJAT-47783]